MNMPRIRNNVTMTNHDRVFSSTSYQITTCFYSSMCLRNTTRTTCPYCSRINTSAYNKPICQIWCSVTSITQSPITRNRRNRPTPHNNPANRNRIIDISFGSSILGVGRINQINDFAGIIHIQIS